MADQAFMYPDLVTTPDHAGRVSVTQGESEATFTNCASFTGRVLAGGTLVALPDSADPIIVGHIAQLDGEYESATLPLMAAYEGTTLTDERFYIVFGLALSTVTELNALLARFRSQMQQGAGLIYYKDDITDPTLVPPNSFRWNPELEQIEQWRNGTWEPRNPSTLGPSVGRWDGNVPKHTLTISTGDVAIDFDDGPDYSLTLSADAELQLPANVEVGSTLDILVIGGGASNELTAATGITGLDDVTINTADSARTRISMVVSAETGGTATAAQIIAVSFGETEVVEDNGVLWRSNIDSNVGEPQYDVSGDPVSDSNWTFVPARKGDPGSALLTATSNTSLSLEAGELIFTLAENAERGFGPGSWVIVADSANPTTNYGLAQASEYDHPILKVVLAADNIVGSGTISNWVITAASLRGAAGIAATIAVGTVDDVPNGAPATVTNSGTSAAAVFDFEIPAGPQGLQGENFEPDEVVATFADRDDFDAEAKGFAVLVEADESKDGESWVYFKLSNSSADWSAGSRFGASTSASAISFDNSGTDLAADDVQEAVEEINDKVNAIPDPVAMAIVFGS